VLPIGVNQQLHACLASLELVIIALQFSNLENSGFESVVKILVICDILALVDFT
jgi:hypothetical protein